MTREFCLFPIVVEIWWRCKYSSILFLDSSQPISSTPDFASRESRSEYRTISSTTLLERNCRQNFEHVYLFSIETVKDVINTVESKVIGCDDVYGVQQLLVTSCRSVDLIVTTHIAQYTVYWFLPPPLQDQNRTEQMDLLQLHPLLARYYQYEKHLSDSWQ